jgi:hypothetical protein
MTRDEVLRIERETGTKLPEYYVDLVINYPTELVGTAAPAHELLNDPGEVIEENLDVRKNGYFGEPWPAHYFIIGRNGLGDYWVVRLDRTHFSIGFSDHEAMRCDKWAESREEFIAKLLKEVSDDAA